VHSANESVSINRVQLRIIGKILHSEVEIYVKYINSHKELISHIQYWLLLNVLTLKLILLANFIFLLL
jgi:hypothetical protein